MLIACRYHDPHVKRYKDIKKAHIKNKKNPVEFDLLLPPGADLDIGNFAKKTAGDSEAF